MAQTRARSTAGSRPLETGSGAGSAGELYSLIMGLLFTAFRKGGPLHLNDGCFFSLAAESRLPARYVSIF